jgi:type IV pilus assembly protein PilP
MGNPKLNYNIKYLLLIIITSCLITLIVPLSSLAKKSANNDDNKENSTVSEEEYSQNVKELMHFLEGRNDDYTYRRDGRSDPFMPFLREKVVDQEIDSTSTSELVGMQKFEPGQLLVVGIIQSRNGPIAMVQDSTGKGYIISPGIKLGRSGVVDEITTNMILIKQQYLMTSGATRHRIVKMMLKHEGE